MLYIWLPLLTLAVLTSALMVSEGPGIVTAALLFLGVPATGWAIMWGLAEALLIPRRGAAIFLGMFLIAGVLALFLAVAIQTAASP